MKNNICSFIIFAVCSLMLIGCSTYQLSTQSLVEQFANTRTEKKVNFLTVYPFFIPVTMNGNDLREIKCIDENQKEYTIRITNRTGIRITKKDSTHTTFYFDTLVLKDSTINGAKSHFIGLSIKPINLKDIQKIELQK